MNDDLVNNIPLTPFKGGDSTERNMWECPLEGTIGVFFVSLNKIITEK